MTEHPSITLLIAALPQTFNIRVHLNSGKDRKGKILVAQVHQGYVWFQK